MRKWTFIALLLAAAVSSCGSSGRKKPAASPATVQRAAQAPKPKSYKAEIIREFPHDVTAYTQGLFFHGGTLYESTGLHGESSLKKVDLRTGKTLQRNDLSDKYFGEGSVILGDVLYMLTWEDKVAFKFDPQTLEMQATVRYPRQGWGLTTDETSLIASDGTANIYFLDTNFKTIKTLKVRLGSRPVLDLNELEYIDGRIWANVYMTSIIVVINPETGYVEATIDCGALKPSPKATSADVLNGIATDGENIYLTGKKWDKLFQVRLIEL